jgi:3-hydroxyisobutyrate dehydrogenase-like beta-hydroxyacid dehydrogenase
MKVEFIGVEKIGAPIARQLLKAGHSLTVHDLRREAAGALLGAGAIWSNSASALAGQSEVVVTCLPGPAEMEKICLELGGIVRLIKPGGLYIDHTDKLARCRPPGSRGARRQSVVMLDASVSSGMEGAQTRDLQVMAGGEPALFEHARPLLDAVAKHVIYTGGIGTGSIAKIMHNSASFTLDLVRAECWTTGVKAEIDAATIVKVFNEAALGQMMSLKMRLPDTYLRGDFLSTLLVSPGAQ